MPPGVEEAGGRDDNPAIHDPGRAWELWNSEVDYAYATEPQVHAAGTRLFWPRGKVLGGSGSLNGMIYVRGAPRRLRQLGAQRYRWHGGL
jgi:choline dehydrogenase